MANSYNYPLVFLYCLLGRSTRLANIDFTTFTGKPVDYIVLSGAIMSLGHSKRDLSVISDFKTKQIPCCRQWRRGFDTPLT